MTNMLPFGSRTKDQDVPYESTRLLKKLFRRGTSPTQEPLPMHLPHSLTKLFGHRSHKPSSPVHEPVSLSYLKLLQHSSPSRPRSISEAHLQIPTHNKLSKAETVAHLHSLEPNPRGRPVSKIITLNTKLTTNGLHFPPLSATPTHERIVYNPYGTNKNLIQGTTPKSTSFYMQGGAGDGPHVLSQPIKNPNAYLPCSLQQPSVDVFDTFEMEAGADKKLGDGGSSDVRLVNLRGHKRELYALKQFVLLSKETDEQFYQRVAQEYVLSRRISMLRHVVDIFGLVRIPTQQTHTRGWGMILEVCTGGDLFNAIIKPSWKRQLLSERYCIFKQIAYGLEFMHKADVVHRDMKPENVLLDGNGIAKLCDFGVSTDGHVVAQDFSSDVKMSYQYVGSPPYSPPEVMILKEKLHSEAKNFAYDPFKMDCWGLGMLLFCIVYGAVPFQAALVSDHAYRDYKFNLDRFLLDHPSFKSNDDYSKGPSVEFKWASQFQSTGALRVAWKLCNPSTSARYNLHDLFSDPWFHGLEMCIYEDPDQLVNPFILPGAVPGFHSPLHTMTSTSTLFSTAPSRSNLQMPSRIGTLDHARHFDEILYEHIPIKSMLDSVEGLESTHEQQKILLLPKQNSLHEEDLLHKTQLDEDNRSIYSALSLTHELLVPATASSFKRTEHELKAFQLSGSSSTDEHAASSSTTNLPAVLEDGEEGACYQDLPNETSLISRQPLQLYHSSPNLNAQRIPLASLESHSDHAQLPLILPSLKDASSACIESNGMCDLGYKIKRHHHISICALVSGSRRR